VTCRLLGDGPERHARADEIKNLKGEIAILRSLLERRLNTIESDAELAAAMPTLKDFALAVQKLAESAHNMDVKLGNLVNKQTLMAIASDIICCMVDNIRTLVGTTPTQEEVDVLVEKMGQQIVRLIAEKENL